MIILLQCVCTLFVLQVHKPAIHSLHPFIKTFLNYLDNVERLTQMGPTCLNKINVQANIETI